MEKPAPQTDQIKIDKVEKIDVSQAVAIVGEIMQQVAVMGGNDYEIPALQAILRALNERECTPEEAIKQATFIKERKSDYH